MIHRFGQFELDERLYELRRRGRIVRIEPKVFDMLAHLVRNRDRVVPQGELLATIWENQHVSESALRYCIRAVRKAIGDDGARQAAIETVRGRGFRFVAAAESEPSAAAAAAAGPWRAAAAPSRAVFVGRDAALNQLRTALESAVAGRGRVVLLTGEAGIGKTRTAEELAGFARERGAEVLGGRCQETTGAPAFWPWVQALRAYAGVRTPGEVLKAMGTAAADLAPLLPDLAPTPAAEMPSDQARFRLFDGLASFLIQAAKARPIVLLLDDLHQADVPSLLALQFVARAVRAARLLILGTSRDTDLDHPLAQIGGELARLDWSERIALSGLSGLEVASFIERSAGLHPSPALVAAVHDKTSGNPFFVTEIVRLLIAEGQIERANAEPSGALPIPRTTSEAIGRRLDGLPAESHAVLAAAAVFGREFDADALALMQGVGPGRGPVRRRREKLSEILDAAEVARLIEPIGHSSGRYRFGHVLVRDALYDEIPSGRRVRLHRLAAEAIERMYSAEIAPHLAALAHHFRQAAGDGDPTKAVLYAARAAAHAASMMAFEDAIRHYREALELVQRAPARAAKAKPEGLRVVGGTRRPMPGALDSRRAESICDLLLGLGECQWKAGEMAAARETFVRAAAVAKPQRLWTHFARAAIGHGGGFRGFDVGAYDATLVELLEEALEHVPRAQTLLHARLLARLAVALCMVPQTIERRRTLNAQALRIVEAAGDAATQLAILYGRHWSLWGPDNLDDRLTTAAKMIELAADGRDPEMELHARRFRVIDLMEAGDARAADRDQDACERLAAQLRQPYYDWYVSVFHCLRLSLQSRLEELERQMQETLAIGQRSQSPNVLHSYGVQTVFLRLERGRLAEIQEQVRQYVEQFPAVPAWRVVLGLTYAEQNRTVEVQRQWERITERGFADLPRDAFWLASVSLACDLCTFVGDADNAALLYGLLASHSHVHVVGGMGSIYIGPVSRYLARLAVTMNRAVDAVRHFEDALTMSERVGCRHLAAHVQREYGELLLRQGNAKQATGLLARATAIYESLGYTRFIELTRELQSRPPSPSRAAVRVIR